MGVLSFRPSRKLVVDTSRTGLLTCRRLAYFPRLPVRKVRTVTDWGGFRSRLQLRGQWRNFTALPERSRRFTKIQRNRKVPISDEKEFSLHPNLRKDTQKSEEKNSLAFETTDLKGVGDFGKEFPDCCFPLAAHPGAFSPFEFPTRWLPGRRTKGAASRSPRRCDFVGKGAVGGGVAVQSPSSGDRS